MNFNTTKKPDYRLQGRLINEMINLYGVPVKLLLTEKLDKDDIVFGDYSSVKVDKDKVFEIKALPENSENWDDISTNFSEFGMLNVENIRMFISSKTVHKIFDEEFKPIRGLQNNLIILPNDKIMEITDVDFHVPGVSNLYTYNDDKNCYKISLKPYHVKLTDNLNDIKDDMVNPETYEQLDKYFDELTSSEDNLKEEAKDNIDTDSGKTVLEEADSVFGRF